MSSTINMPISLGDAGEHDAEVFYGYIVGSDGGRDEPPTNEEFWVEHVFVKGLDILRLFDKRVITEMVRDYVVVDGL